ncbi:MAG: lipoyl synthase [Nitrospirae bacterium]|nr:lipoyl synthase [Nitrospirota bacterium]
MRKYPVVEERTRLRLPEWFKVHPVEGEGYRLVAGRLKASALHTVCEEARCPNIWECWNAGTATFMILGEVCTRSCGFCAVTTGRPEALDREEPARVGEAAAALGLRHVVVTSVNRDELEDGGATTFAETVRQIRQRAPDCRVELLIPDFRGAETALRTVLEAGPDILGHNVETVPRLYPRVRQQAKYLRSLEVLERAKARGALTKTGIMLGLGETEEEIRQVFHDLRAVGCDILTLGQYLQPTRRHLPVERFYTPEEFTALGEEARTLGFSHVESGPKVRSSYHAEKVESGVRSQKSGGVGDK